MGTMKMTVTVDKDKYLKFRGRLLAEGLFVSEWVGLMIDKKISSDVEYSPELKKTIRETTGVDIDTKKELGNKAADTYFTKGLTDVRPKAPKPAVFSKTKQVGKK